MENVFLNSTTRNRFSWNDLGAIHEGREHLGEEMPVLFYRLMQFAMREELNRAYGREAVNRHFKEAGRLAGAEFAKNSLELYLSFDCFAAHLANIMLQMKIGILRFESVIDDGLEIILTVSEDLDCSGLPASGKLVCNYNEGFIAGILEIYTGKNYNVSETDCWATGDRTCRYLCKLEL